MRAALDAVSPDLGPMNVVTPGRNTDTANLELLDYADASSRTALLEQAPGLPVAAVQASLAALRAATVRGAEGLSRLGGMWPQHLTGPGATPGTTRTVPATIAVAGLVAGLERSERHPNVAPFGDFGVPTWATTIADPYTEADAVALFDSGANVFTGLPRGAAQPVVPHARARRDVGVGRPRAHPHRSRHPGAGGRRGPRDGLADDQSRDHLGLRDAAAAAADGRALQARARCTATRRTRRSASTSTRRTTRRRSRRARSTRRSGSA
jgi:hypothetical protein